MNLQRGELIISLSGVDYKLTPTFTAMAVIESHSGKGILQLGLDLANMKASGSKDIAAVIYGGVWGAIEPKQPKDMPFTMTELNELIFKEGISKFYVKCLKFVNDMVSGQTSEEKDLKNETPTDTVMN